MRKGKLELREYLFYLALIYCAKPAFGTKHINMIVMESMYLEMQVFKYISSATKSSVAMQSKVTSNNACMI